MDRERDNSIHHPLTVTRTNRENNFKNNDWPGHENSQKKKKNTDGAMRNLEDTSATTPSPSMDWTRMHHLVLLLGGHIGNHTQPIYGLDPGQPSGFTFWRTHQQSHGPLTDWTRMHQLTRQQPPAHLWIGPSGTHTLTNEKPPDSW